MRALRFVVFALLVATLAPASLAHAVANTGTPAPLFSKNQLFNGGVGSVWALSGHPGKVLILHMLGYN